MIVRIGEEALESAILFGKGERGFYPPKLSGGFTGVFIAM